MQPYHLEKLKSHISQIISISDEEFDLISGHFSHRKIRRKQYLIGQGDDVTYEYLVLSGIYKVFYVDENGKELIVQFAKENWWMTDYPAFFRQQKATMYIECIQEGEVLCATLQSRETLAANLHKMEHFYRIKLTNGYLALQQRVKLLLSSTLQQRYEEFARLYPDLLQSVPKKIIAEYLGVSRETLSRLYSQ